MSSFSSTHTLKFFDGFKHEVRIHYLLYDELPLLAKWVEVQGEGLDIGIDYVEVWSTSLSISTLEVRDCYDHLIIHHQELAVEAEVRYTQFLSSLSA